MDVRTPLVFIYSHLSAFVNTQDVEDLTGEEEVTHATSHMADRTLKDIRRQACPILVVFCQAESSCKVFTHGQKKKLAHIICTTAEDR